MEKKIDRDDVKSFFEEYTGRYDHSDPRVRLKIEHTYKVADIAERIAKSLDMNEREVDLAWLLGMLHDVGRFEQLRRYDTFYDAKSTDHAKLGADLLYDEDLITDFTDALSEEELYLTETAIRLHNKLTVPNEYEGKIRTFIDLLRDADKADIFRVMVTVPYEERGGKGQKEEEPKARDELMDYVKAHKCIPYAPDRTRFESYIGHCCMAFELVYEETVLIVKEQGYLDALLNGVGEYSDLPKDGEARRQLDILKEEIYRRNNLK